MHQRHSVVGRTAFDAILLDAPCSASGVIRRHPDIKLLRRASDIAALGDLQRSLLDSLWPLLAPGGRLLYVTCSVLAAENDEVLRRFLEATADAREEDVLQNNNIRDLMRARRVVSRFCRAPRAWTVSITPASRRSG